MLRMFADETGDHRDPATQVFGVVGIVGKVHTWHQLQSSWEDVLECNGIRAFHATDVENFGGEFSGWTSSQRERLISMLVRVVQEHINELRFVGAMMVMSEYDKLPEDRKNNLGNIYKFGCMNAISGALNVAGEDFEGDAIQFIFDQKQKHERLQDEAYHEIRSVNPFGNLCAGITRGNHRLVSPIQVADLFAYESNKYAKGRLAGKTRDDLRWPAKQFDEHLEKGKIILLYHHSLMLCTDFDGSYEKQLKDEDRG
jgi:hypothetical protein